MRFKIREIMKLICQIYPARKLFGYIECLGELANLIQRNGMGVCSPAKMFPLIAAQIAHRDAAVRNGATNAITQAYILIGDHVSDKDKSLLEEKFKRLTAAPVVIPEPVADDAAVKNSALPIYSQDVVEENEETRDVEQPVELQKNDELMLDFDQFENPKPVSGIPVALSTSYSSSESEELMDKKAAPETGFNHITDSDTLKHLEMTIASLSPHAEVPAPAEANSLPVQEYAHMYYSYRYC
jgi:hypothetical protein